MEIFKNIRKRESIMEPRYSVLICGYPLDNVLIKADQWLSKGIKLFVFIGEEEEDLLRDRYSKYIAASLLFIYNASDFYHRLCIYDARVEDEGQFEMLCNAVSSFNGEQYLVEHCQSDKNIIVEASAGTGKTTVMIDRIMYLLHSHEDLSLSEIIMITFTNDATNQMRKRLQESFLKRYTATGDVRYLHWMEEESQMDICTIDSFFYGLLRSLGVNQGYNKELSIKSFKYQRSQIIRDILDELPIEKSTVTASIGLPIYRAEKVILRYWEKLKQLGLSDEEIKAIDWGTADDKASKPFQRTLINVFDSIEDNFRDLKFRENAISLDDIVRELQYVLESNEDNEINLSCRYLFVDEFQDSDNAQIRSFARIMAKTPINIFVVGDVKQSIYRFRGATDTAFETLCKEIKEVGSKEPVTFKLTKNYRTAKNVLDKMDMYFSAWGEMDLIPYDGSIIAQHLKKGRMIVHDCVRESFLEEATIRYIKDSISECTRRNGETKELKDSQRVVVLTRTNRQLHTVAGWCKKAKIPAYVKAQGQFYTSEAVRDFYTMIMFYLFEKEPAYKFNYILTPYAGVKASVNLEELEGFNGDKDCLNQYLDSLLNSTRVPEYRKKFRLMPTLAVLMELINDKSLMANYISRKSTELLVAEWDEERIENYCMALAAQYSANLQKLMEILKSTFDDDFTSLYQIYSFLKLSIATNREEDEPEVSLPSGSDCVYCMTVHKAKGLEFDTVIIPFTSNSFRFKQGTELLADTSCYPIKVGWYFKDEKADREMKNSYYDQCSKEEDEFAAREETRILYVAMTRAIHKLVCLVWGDREATWGNLIKRVGADDE